MHVSPCNRVFTGSISLLEFASRLTAPRFSTFILILYKLWCTDLVETVKAVSGVAPVRYVARARGWWGHHKQKLGKREVTRTLYAPARPRHPVVSRIMTDVLVNRFVHAAPGLNVSGKKESSRDTATCAGLVLPTPPPPPAPARQKLWKMVMARQPRRYIAMPRAWESIAICNCDYLHLPDLSSRASTGTRFEKFEKIYSHLRAIRWILKISRFWTFFS